MTKSFSKFEFSKLANTFKIISSPIALEILYIIRNSIHPITTDEIVSVGGKNFSESTVARYLYELKSCEFINSSLINTKTQAKNKNGYYIKDEKAKNFIDLIFLFGKKNDL